MLDALKFGIGHSGGALSAPRDRKSSALRMRALAQTFAWTDLLLARLLKDGPNPRRAAVGFAQRLQRKGLLQSEVYELQSVVVGEQPLWSSTNEQKPNCDALAYALERRFSGASKPTRVYWPSQEFGKRFGTWTGADSYSCPHKLSHDVLITAVWLNYLEHSPEIALRQWLPERWLQWVHRRGEWQGPIPDALISDGSRTTAIEIGGNYSAVWIRHHIQRFESAGWDWQLW